jgi:hypothetical protein
VGADRPGDADLPPDDHPDRRDDQDGTGDPVARAGNAQAETRTRQEYYSDLRVAITREESVVARQITTEEEAASEKWQEKVAESRWMWSEYQRKWPPAERPAADRSTGSSDSWRGDRGRSLDNADNSRVEAECDRIAEREQEKISPALRAIESQDPDRHLIGFEYRLKGRDRIKEKVYDKMEEFSCSAEEAACHGRGGSRMGPAPGAGRAHPAARARRAAASPVWQQPVLQPARTGGIRLRRGSRRHP